MKSHEGELEREISKVQGMVCELRAGFSRALLELNQIQQGDTELQSQLEDTRHGCNKRSLHLESLVLSLKEELEEVRCQFRQLGEAQERKAPENPGRENNGVDDRSGQSNGAAEAPPLSSVGGDFLIHCYLQGLQVWQWARQNSGEDSLSCHVTHSCLRRGRRRGVVEMLLQSERDYVSSLNQLYEKYKSAEQNVALVKHIDQMLQHHLLFRNTLEERLTTDERSCAAGDAFLNLTGQNNVMPLTTKIIICSPIMSPLRNGRKHICDLTPGGWTAEYMWNGSAGKSPICAPFARHPREAGRFPNPVPPVGVEGNLTAAAKSQSSSAGLAVRVCGSPGLDGRIYTSDQYPLSHRLDDGDTECDVADASVFDFSSVTTCSPDETLNQLRGAEAGDDEDDDEEDSEVPVLLKPSYTHNASAMQAGGSLCMQWQIPRRAPIPAEVWIGAQGKTRAPKPHRMPTSAFRPIWDPTYSQGDATPAKENAVSFSSTNQIINQQQETDQSRSAYRGTGVQRAEAVWHDSEDSEGPCSTV
ncbi:uncharacterized protein [Sinocyclocheilus grahami]|uniref:uncharacterized protein n=1 Tax=Sinocyclocheilus grahami TaxID=75366 RepID=UPI0007AD1AD8|nr:PREDICTED: uncharacterized protein LOC107553178 [Sinocyclocheilus grahami]